jgi:release factor glutamine methyltransferase
MTDIRTILHRTTRDLTAGGSPSPRLDAEVLLMRFLGMDRLQFCMQPERELSQEEAAGFAGWVARRSLGEPVAYILGEKEFWSLRFEVGREVLIPRPETECLIEEALRFCRPPGEGLRVLDIGTGSGAIGVVLARELPAARVVATDISPGALAVARRNVTAHGVAGRMEFFQGDLFAAVAGEFDIICSNPPYIPEGVYDLLPAGIRDFEPRGALVAGTDGLDFYRRIIREGLNRLKTGGRIFLEIGEGQRNRVDALFRDDGGYDDIAFRKDYGGIDRVASARKILGDERWTRS